MQRLQDALIKTVQQGRARAMTVSADSGVGKSRLVHEFEQWVDIQPWEVFWFRGRAAPHMQRLPYALLRDVFTMRLQIQESDPLAVVQAKMEAGILEAF
jgi:predicted ATPase